MRNYSRYFTLMQVNRPRCRSVITREGERVRCMLHSGHKGWHKQAPYFYTWKVARRDRSPF